MKKPFFYLYSLLFVFLSSGCAPAVIGAAGTTGAVLSHDKRTVGSFVEDEAIELKARKLILSDQEINDKSHINITSYNGIVLLTGEALTQEIKSRIASLVKNIEKVRAVHDEVGEMEPSSILARTTDSSITALVKSKMLATRDFDGTRVKVVTERGTVYLMGIVTRQAADIAAEITRTSRGVEKVVRLFEYSD